MRASAIGKGTSYAGQLLCGAILLLLMFFGLSLPSLYNTLPLFDPLANHGLGLSPRHQKDARTTTQEQAAASQSKPCAVARRRMISIQASGTNNHWRALTPLTNPVRAREPQSPDHTDADIRSASKVTPHARSLP
ncbi:hypothetical protein BDY21DRAFT_89643 [Lineolata rhizophorae]|uniref:Uncharacterized protein n=1 Tax=Lineolata rhizophorae TaxID=578093 RepID=A0A6A6PCI6_9PEZI|nr:hypothetical protein BDY21DRAFT_89643 [Lineolata rhizophorae]